jgi:hypothetical protein
VDIVPHLIEEYSQIKEQEDNNIQILLRRFSFLLKLKDIKYNLGFIVDVQN